MHSDSLFCVYGAPDAGLAAVPGNAVQVSPLVPGAESLEDMAPGGLSGMAIAAPAGTLERRYVMALALRALQPGAPLTVMAPKDKGGSRLVKELEAFGCAVDATSRRHQRICHTLCPVNPPVDAAIAAGEPQFVGALNRWSQPGIFSWDRPDPGTALLLSVLSPLAGRGADLGCGVGVIADAILANAGVTHLDLVDIDRRAVAAARRNVTDPRAVFHWADVRSASPRGDLDFIVMNPPFHDGGVEDKGLGQAFVRRAHQSVRGGGKVWLVANRHLPYEGVLAPLFAQVTLRADSGGFKVYEAQT